MRVTIHDSDEDVYSILWPLNVMSLIFFLPKYTIKSNVIKKNTIITNVVCFFGVTCFGFLHLVRVYVVMTVFANSYFLYITAIFDFFFYCSGFYLSYFVTLLNGDSTLRLVYLLKKIFKNVEWYKYSYFRRFNIFTWIRIGTLISFYVAITIIQLAYMDWISYELLATLSLFHFDMNVMCATRLVQILKKLLLVWNTDRNRVFKAFSGKPKQEKTKTVIKSIWNRISCTYDDILEAYSIYVKVFEVMIVYHTMETFLHSLIYVQFVIELIYCNVNPRLKKCQILSPDRQFNTGGPFPITEYLSFLIVLVWIGKNIVCLCTLSLQCQMFYNAVEDCYCSSLLMLKKKDCPDDAVAACENVRRATEVMFKKMEPCGLFAMDAKLPLQLVSGIAAYTTVLLQFAFVNLISRQ